MNKPIKIIQCSNPGSGSTVLVNILMAFFQPYEGVSFMGKSYYREQIIEDNIVIKTHDKRIDDWIEKYGKKYSLYFIISDRHDYDWHKYYNYDEKVLFIEYEDLLETNDNSLDFLVKKIYERIEKFLPKDYIINNRKNVSIQNGINRINNMNKRYSEIKNKPFEFVDKYYQIHGNHRNKNHNESKLIRKLQK